jgi:acyl-CoA reductase-like NAD-dependent aldehyde dehydrogenase
VDRGQAAAEAFRAIGDQAHIDRIVRAMVVAGLEAAVELAELALEETGFGVLEDKVVKNYVATEFLYDHLQDKRSVGVIDEDPERGIQYVAEPVGGSSSRCSRSPTRHRPRCSSRSSRPRPATRSSSARPPPAAPRAR